MPNDSRSFVDVIQDTVSNIQDIVSSEIRLARSEMTTEARKAAKAGQVLAAGIILSIYGLGLLLLAAVYALAIVMPLWGAALVVFAIVAVIAASLIVSGRGRLKQVYAKPDTAIQSVKEDLRWLTSHAR